jgi:hypothetical protein
VKIADQEYGRHIGVTLAASGIPGAGPLPIQPSGRIDVSGASARHQLQVSVPRLLDLTSAVDVRHGRREDSATRLLKLVAVNNQAHR